MLTEEMKKEIDEFVSNLEIDDVSGMSGEWCDYGVERSPRWFEPDEDEYFEAQKEKAIDYIKSDGAVEHIELITQEWDKITDDLRREDWSSYMDELVIKYIEEMK